MQKAFLLSSLCFSFKSAPTEQEITFQIETIKDGAICSPLVAVLALYPKLLDKLSALDVVVL